MYTTQRAVKTFVTVANEWSTATISFAAAAAVCFIRAERDKDADLGALQDRLQDAISETKGRSQTYRYIAQGRKLARKLAADFPDANGAPDGVVHDALDAKTPSEAVNVIVFHLQKADVASADKLDVFLGAAPRSQRAAKGGTEPKARHASTEAIVATFEDADPPRADELFSELIGAAPLSILERWQELLAEEITSRSRRRRGRASGMSDRSKTNAGAALQ